MTDDWRPWVRVALIPPAVLLLIVGVWLLPALTPLDTLAAALIGIAWLVVLIAALRVLTVKLAEPERERVSGDLFVDDEERSEWLAQFVTLLTLSTVIAALGLMADSTAVVIGAMVVAPLMSPLMSLAGALTMARPGQIAVSAIVVAVGSVLTVAVAVVVSWVVPGTETTAELLGRTQPSLPDLGIALAAGAAGAYVVVHPSALGALPGVAIAVALVPPLATVVVMLEIGERRKADDALILFLTNLVAIVLAACVVFVVTGFSASASEIRSRRGLQLGIGIAVAATLVVMTPLAKNSVARHEELATADEVRDALEPVARAQGTVIEHVTIREQSDRLVAAVELLGPLRPRASDFASVVAQRLDEPVELELAWRYKAVAKGAERLTTLSIRG
jgi:uncharacterized hydrophobic protein (TIGR00271 family)